MELTLPKQLLPTLPMVAECLAEAGWNCGAFVSDRRQQYREVRLYHRKQALKKDVLYLLRPEEKAFPVNEYSYITSGKITGKANHLICPAFPDEEILDCVLEVLSQFRNWEEEINNLLYRNASLQTLCDVGTEILNNPVWIHDDWFMMMAMNSELAQIMEPEYLMSSSKGFVPRAVVEDFRNDSNYLETFAHHGAQIWYAPKYNHESMYVNLWDGTVYKGRLLIARKNREFRERDFQIAEALAQRALILLRRKTLSNVEVYQNMDDIVFTLLQGMPRDSVELEHLLSMLHWQKEDRFLCLQIRYQGSEGTAIADRMLHSDLFRCFPGSYVLLDHQQQCVILNLTQCEDYRNQLRQLAQLCRDRQLYVGASSPVDGIQELHGAYTQAGIALDRVLRNRREKRLMQFSECAIGYLVQKVASPLTPKHLVSPELTALKEHDQQNNTPYFETLRQYLLLERDIPKTAEMLIIHRSTLLYRLKKIQSIINLDLDDPWQRLQLMLSLWILEKEEKGTS